MFLCVYFLISGIKDRKYSGVEERYLGRLEQFGRLREQLRIRSSAKFGETLVFSDTRQCRAKPFFVRRLEGVETRR
jgi:hypothetical protein